MVVNKLIEIYQNQKEVRFKLYSLEYVIKEDNNLVAIYPLLYPQKKNRYKTIEELLNYYMIYNESILENVDRLIIITKVG